MERVMVIEDTGPAREEIETILSLEGYQVVSAMDGTAGVEMARAHIPDLIICDIMMPGLDGYEVFNELKKSPLTASIPFIFLTAKATREDRRKGMNEGADDYLTKPFTAQELLSAIRARLARKDYIIRHTREQLNELRKNIIHSLPHEILTPLNGIIGISDVLIRSSGSLTDREVEDMAGVIRKSAERLFRLVHNFLSYANIQVWLNDEEKIRNLRNGISKKSNEIVRRVSMVKAKQMGREADLELNLKDAVFPLSEVYLVRIMDEILDNAFKFSHAGQHVQVATEEVDGMGSLRVTDYGIGMDEEEIRSIGGFMQFNQKELEQQGSGLGLSIVQGLAALHNGNFQIRSSPHEYTEIRIDWKSPEA